jgi:hypothetical protein
MASPHLVGFGQRTQLLACLSLWLDRTLALAAELPSVPLEMQLYAEEDEGWLSLYLTTMYRCCRCATPTPRCLNSPGKGMELRLIQTWWRTIAARLNWLRDRRAPPACVSRCLTP